MSNTEDKISQYRKICSQVTLQEKKEGFFLNLAEALSEKIDKNIFARFTTDFERVKFVTAKCWNFIGAELIYRGKKQEESIARRVEGNKFFEKGDYDRALLCYCQSIVQAPVGPELVNVYSNRSALLYKMAEYELAITDAELAISYGSPENTRHKLYERMASCYNSLKNYHKAKVILRLAKHFAEKHDKENEKFTQKLDKLSLSIQTAMEKESKVNGSSTKQTSQSNNNNDTPNFKPGKKFPSASEKFDVNYSPGVGRYAVAKKKIRVGEEVLREKPYASCLSTDKMGTFCLHCFIRLKAPIACETCANVAFCSRNCKKEAESYHQYECRIQALLYGSGMSLNCYLALRIITQSSQAYFKEILPQLNVNVETIPVNSDDKLDSSSYRSIYNLGGLEDQRTPEDFIDRTIMAVFLMKCLRLVGYFDINLFKNPFPTEFELRIGALILRNIQVVQFNAYEVCEFLMENKTSYEKSKPFGLGLAIYSTASYFNHSCSPTVGRYFIGTTMVSTTISTIEANQALFDNYGPLCTKTNRDDRRLRLNGRYWFHCSCEACINSWPTMNDALVEIEPKNADEMTAIKKLQKLEPLYFDAAMKSMADGKANAAIELHKVYIEESEKILANYKDASFYPYKTVRLAQQAIQLCYCSLGSVHYTEKLKK